MKDYNIIFLGGAYRYVNHALKRATPGWATKEAVIRNKYMFRFDSISIPIMEHRYLMMMVE